MDFLTGILLKLSAWMRPYLSQIATAMMVTLLVIYGSSVNRAVKKHISHHNFLIRLIVFVLLCAFGYGAVMALATPILAQYLSRLRGIYLSPVVILSFLFIGILAERKKQM
jgi:hypothetical protein